MFHPCISDTHLVQVFGYMLSPLLLFPIALIGSYMASPHSLSFSHPHAEDQEVPPGEENTNGRCGVDVCPPPHPPEPNQAHPLALFDVIR